MLNTQETREASENCKFVEKISKTFFRKILH